MLLLSSSCQNEGFMVSYYDERVDREDDDEDAEDAEGSEGNHSDKSEDEDRVKEERQNDIDNDRDKDGDIGGEERQNDRVRRNSSESRPFDLTTTSPLRAMLGNVRRSRTPDPPGDCELCNNPRHNRHAWGLIIHPTEKAGEYYRVSVFSSRAGKVGGTKFFRGLKKRSIDLV